MSDPSARRARRQKRARQGQGRRRRSARLIRPRDETTDQEEFQLLPSLHDSLAPSHYPTPPKSLSFPLSLSFSLLLVSEKTFLIKNPVRDLDLSIDLVGNRYLQRRPGRGGLRLGGKVRAAQSPPWVFPSSSIRCSLSATRILAVYPLSHPPLVSPREGERDREREREREKRRKKAAAALPTRGNDADRDLKAAFSAEEKRPGCLKRARRKTCRFAIPFSSLLLLLLPPPPPLLLLLLLLPFRGRIETFPAASPATRTTCPEGKGRRS